MISKELVLSAQEKWSQALVEIGQVFSNDGDYTATASKVIDELYAYDTDHPVLFKPTKAKEAPFRSTKEMALSYFVATNGECSEDKGFALAPWKSVRFENHEIAVFENTAHAMGQYFFEDSSGGLTKVEYTFGYVLVGSDLKIVLHHSSLPFSG